MTVLLRHLDKRLCADTTRYGGYSTHDFYGHHAAAISLAIATGEAEAIVNGVSRRKMALWLARIRFLWLGASTVAKRGAPSSARTHVT